MNEVITGVAVYLLIGWVFGYLFRTEDGRPAWATPVLAMAVLLLWPVFLGYNLSRVESITYRGKEIWRNKR